MKLVIGLGNPGGAYEKNRHNLGFMCVNYFAKEHGIRFDKKQGKSRIGSGRVNETEVMLAKPQTYMNSSGEAVRLLVNKFKVDLSDVIVIHDDLDLLLGKIRIRSGGSAGGHKGVQSIIDELGSTDFVRVRIGVGHPPSEEDYAGDVIDWVLTDFTHEELEVINQVIPKVSEAIECLVSEGLVPAMNKYNAWGPVRSET